MANKRQSEREATPQDFPQVTPRISQPGHDFTLQTVMEMQRSLGELGAKVDRLINDVKGHGEKLDSVRMRLAWVAGGAAVLGFLVAVGLALLKLLPVSLPAT